MLGIARENCLQIARYIDTACAKLITGRQCERIRQVGAQHQPKGAQSPSACHAKPAPRPRVFDPNMICNTAVKTVSAERNPCDVRSAINPTVAQKGQRFPPQSSCTVSATKLALTRGYERFKHGVLAGCGDAFRLRSPNCAAGWRC